MTTFMEYERHVREEVYFDWPMIARALGWGDLCLSWQMEYYERTALIAVLAGLQPAVAIEVGTAAGGSLAVMSRFAERVYTFDVRAESRDLLAGRFSNVEFITGSSFELLPPLVAKIEREQRGPTFFFIDGDHSAASVRTDITNALRFRPKFPTVIMGHDSFNPGCRSGILAAPWSDNPHVHLVEIDFVKGSIFDRAGGEMWGGFYFALLLPEPRSDALVISERHRLLFEMTRKRSAHNPLVQWRRRLRRFLAHRTLR